MADTGEPDADDNSPPGGDHGDEQRPEPERDSQSSPGRPVDGDPLPDLDEVLRQTKQFINYGNTVIYTPSDSSADGSPARVPARILSETDVHAGLTYFAPPSSYVEASAKLHRHRFVILCGEQGTGRRCVALALLTLAAPSGVDCRAPVTELLPHTTIEELLGITFEPSRRYVLPDFDPGDTPSERLRFLLDELGTRVAATDAVLVATTCTPVDAFPSHAVDFGKIDCGKVVDAYLRRRKHYHDDAAADNLRTLARKRRPSEMPAFFNILEESGASAVSQHFQHSDQHTVESLIAEKPETPSLLPLVAAAFLPGAIERNFEEHLDQLREDVDEHAQRSRWLLAYADSLAQSRSDRAGWVVPREHPTDRRERGVTLADTVEPAFLLTHLRQHYGRELWGPVHSWLLERPEMLDVRDEPALARGMAVFARIDPTGAQAVLDVWAAQKELPPRWAAAAAVSAMCNDNDNADEALQIAIRWSATGRRQKIVAAMAFGQALGLRRPVEAMSHLWYLCLGDMIVARLARVQFVAFIQVTAQDAGLVRLALSIVDWQLEQQLLGRAYPDKSIKQAIDTVAALLSAEITTEKSLTLHALRLLPEQISILGSLWAEVLRTWPHRVAGLDVLRAAHHGLASTGETQIFTDLGAAIAQRLTQKEWEWVCQDLALPSWTPAMGHSEVAA